MNQPPAFQLYADDFLGGTADMTTEEVGAYIRLLCHQWNKGFVPNDDTRLMVMAGLTQPLSLAFVKTKFKQGTDGLLRNDRLERVRQAQIEYRASQAENGKKGGRPRVNETQTKGYPNPSLTQPLSQTKAKANPNESSPTPSPTPVSKLQIQSPPEPDGFVLVEDFGRELMRLFFRTKPSDRLTHMEQSLAAAIIRERPDYWNEFKILQNFKATGKYFPQSLSRLLDNWQEQLDRAANQPTVSANGKKSLIDQEQDALDRQLKKIFKE